MYYIYWEKLINILKLIKLTLFIIFTEWVHLAAPYFQPRKGFYFRQISDSVLKSTT